MKRIEKLLLKRCDAPCCSASSAKPTVTALWVAERHCTTPNSGYVSVYAARGRNEKLKNLHGVLICEEVMVRSCLLPVNQ
jgi:hypothetical protein